MRLFTLCFSTLSTIAHIYANTSPIYTDYMNTDWVETTLTDSHLDNHSEIKQFYSTISNMYSPTHEDYLSITNYFSKLENRPYLKWLNTFYESGIDYGYINKSLNMQISNQNQEYKINREIYNTDESTENVCIVCYSSSGYHNPSYKIQRIKQSLKDVNYKGHFLYREGGFPDIKGGSLYLTHVPYSFKVCMIKEAYSLGYRKILWFDTSIQPKKNFDNTVKQLETDGYICFSHNNCTLWDRSTIKLRNYFQITQAKEKSIGIVIAGIIGFNFETEIGRKFFNSWYGSAVALDPYLTPRPDQALLSIIAGHLNIKFLSDLKEQEEFFSILR